MSKLSKQLRFQTKIQQFHSDKHRKVLIRDPHIHREYKQKYTDHLLYYPGTR